MSMVLLGSLLAACSLTDGPVGVAYGYAQLAPLPGKGSLTGGAQCVWNLKLVP
ncbi:MAG: hypothetical protein NTNFB02_08390 [Nitrospira sp.]